MLSLATSQVSDQISGRALGISVGPLSTMLRYCVRRSLPRSAHPLIRGHVSRSAFGEETQRCSLTDFLAIGSDNRQRSRPPREKPQVHARINSLS
jgi:hypothetical protein